MADDRSYKEDEVRAIIDRALESQPAAGVSHGDLLAIGAGVGLSPEALEQAANEVREERLNQAAVLQVVAKRRRGILAHAFVFLAINGFLLLINFLTTPGQWWALFPIFGWGLGLLLHVGFALSKTVSPARVRSERGRLEKRQSTRPSALRVAERSPGIRVAGQSERSEQSEQPEQLASVDELPPSSPRASHKP